VQIKIGQSTGVVRASAACACSGLTSAAGGLQFERNNAPVELESASFSLVYKDRSMTLDLVRVCGRARLRLPALGRDLLPPRSRWP